MNARRAAMSLGLVLAILTPAAAQAPAEPPGIAYKPGLGDLMTMTIQPRHIKLALAGRAGNWPYAAYELHELQEAFDRATNVWPTWRSLPVREMEKSALRDPLDMLDRAIKARDGEGFKTGYEKLTEACDACHAAADRPFVVIRVPDQDAFPDQDFQPAKR